jgi:uncharacterized protein YkwD
VPPRARIPRRALVAFAAAVAILPASAAAPASAGSASGCGPVLATAGQVPQAALERATLCLLNRQRARRKLRPLKSNRRLARAARVHAEDMIVRRFFAHVSPEGRDFIARIRDTGYLRVRRWLVGENIGWGSQERSTPEHAVRLWMASPTHRANVLSRRYREIGIAVAWGAPAPALGTAATYVTTFGRVTR